MRVALVNKLFAPSIGGVERHVQLLAETLLQLRGDCIVEVLVGQEKCGGYKEERHERLIIKRAATLARLASTPIAIGLYGILERSEADIFHFHFPYPWIEMFVACRGLKAPYVVTYHSDIVRQKRLLRLYKPYLKRFLDGANKIIVWSPMLADSSLVLREYRRKIEIIPGGIDTRKFNVSFGEGYKVHELRKSLSGNLLPLILFVGRFVYYKGLDVLLDAIVKVPAQLILVGQGPLKQALLTRAIQNGVADRVKFVGEVSEEVLPLFYAACDVFVLPSTEASEAYGLVQLEAHASGLPVVSTSLPTGVPFVNENGKTGFVVPPKDSRSLAAALNTLIEDEGLRKAMGEYAKDRAKRKFDMRELGCDVISLYEKVIAT